jgi:WD40 repeat protein
MGGKGVQVRIGGGLMSLGAIDDVAFKLCGVGAGSVLASVGCDQGIWLWDTRCGAGEGLGGACGLVMAGRSSSSREGMCVEWCPHGDTLLPGPRRTSSEWLVAVGRESDAGVYLWDCRNMQQAVERLGGVESESEEAACASSDSDIDEDGTSTPPARRNASSSSAAAGAATSSSSSSASASASSSSSSSSAGDASIGTALQIAIAKHHDEATPGVTALAWAPWAGNRGERLVLASAGSDGITVLWDINQVLEAELGRVALSSSGRVSEGNVPSGAPQEAPVAGAESEDAAASEDGPPASAESTSTKVTAPRVTKGKAKAQALSSSLPTMPQGAWGRLKPDPDADEVPRACAGVLFVHRGHRSPSLADLRWCPTLPGVSSTSAQPSAASASDAEAASDDALDDASWQDGWLMLWRPLGLAVHATKD